MATGSSSFGTRLCQDVIPYYPYNSLALVHISQVKGPHISVVLGQYDTSTSKWLCKRSTLHLKQIHFGIKTVTCQSVKIVNNAIKKVSQSQSSPWSLRRPSRSSSGASSCGLTYAANFSKSDLAAGCWDVGRDIVSSGEGTFSTFRVAAGEELLPKHILGSPSECSHAHAKDFLFHVPSSAFSLTGTCSFHLTLWLPLSGWVHLIK